MLLIFFTFLFSSPFFVYLRFPRIYLWRISSLKEEKNRRACTFFLFVWNFIVLVYNGWKQSLILQTKPNRLLQISFFFIGTLFVYFKKGSCDVCGETWVWICLYVSTFVCISYFSSQIDINPTTDAFLV